VPNFNCFSKCSFHFQVLHNCLGPAPYKAKSPNAGKAQKAGKAGTKWDPFVFGGKGPSNEEVRNLGLDRAAKNGEDASCGANEDTDHQLGQFVKDMSVIGNSSGKCPTILQFHNLIPGLL
jgi:hypothetical protein